MWGVSVGPDCSTREPLARKVVYLPNAYPLLVPAHCLLVAPWCRDAPCLHAIYFNAPPAPSSIGPDWTPSPTKRIETWLLCCKPSHSSWL